ncbi:MAG: ornithine cyclodeaminase family protein [Candidatus Kariarchaeaceae archaeon]|jgi:ornithine cyclodeaminase
MVKIYNLDQIKDVLTRIDPVKLIEEGFVAYSQGKVVVPPVGEMIFEDPPGELHIKYGYIKDDEYYVIKIASGFHENAKLGLPSNNGMMLLFNQKTGELVSILLDEGHLTDVRTAAAGAVVAKYLAPSNVHRIGIMGPGIQGRMQLQYLQSEIKCKDVLVWGRNKEKLENYKIDMGNLGFNIETSMNVNDMSTCNFIVTCTPSTEPILLEEFVRKGTHITAMGSDTKDKQELDPKILQNADRIIVDSIPQAKERGESYQAMKVGLIDTSDIVELGEIISDQNLGRCSDDEITVTDLTGVAVQDIQITKAVYEALK